ncbi:hypothetical protein BRC77_01055 [Halobacteriales archaeon QH_8_64_26]|nr:MAG: hypothetical protein BRC77_01055 [Halobacteriales archaeon QH_8_64_26]
MATPPPRRNSGERLDPESENQPPGVCRPDDEYENAEQRGDGGHGHDQAVAEPDSAVSVLIRVAAISSMNPAIKPDAETSADEQ